MANNDRSRKLLVRSALITGTTLATLVGAQNLALIDSQTFQNDSEPVENTVVTTSDTTETISKSAPEITIQPVAPHITILRQSQYTPAQNEVAQQTSSVQSTSSNQISAPVPVTVEQQPVVISQPRSSRSRSSR